MANGDNSFPTWQNPSLLSEWPEGQAPSPMAPPGGPPPTPGPTPSADAQAPTTLPSAAPDLSQSMPQPAPPGPVANQQGLPPAYTGPANRGGPVKNALTRMMYGMGQAMMQHVGLPTDYDIQKEQFNQAIQANDLQLKQAAEARAQQQMQYQQQNVMLPNGVSLPLAVAQRAFPAYFQEQGRVAAAQIANRFLKIPNVGAFDTQNLDAEGQPQLVAGTQQPNITVTQDHINRYGLPQEYLGQTLPATQFASALNAAARWAPQTRTGVQNLVTAQGVVQAPVSSTTQRGRPVPSTIAAPAQGGGVPAAAVQQMPAGSPGRNAIAGAGGGPTVRPLQMPGGGPVLPQAAWNEYDNKYLQPANAVEKSYQMMNSAYNQYQAAKNAGQTLPTGAQSMVALSQHLATTFGGVKGARITKDMIAEHLGARSISDDALVAFQKLSNGDPLSPDQWAAFHELIGQSRNIQWQQAAKYGNARGFNLAPYLPSDLQNLNKPLGGTAGAGATQPSAAPNFFQQFGGTPR